jgi:hypothetical protein
MLNFLTFEFPNRATEFLGIFEVRYFHDFVWFVEIGAISSPESPPAAPSNPSRFSLTSLTPRFTAKPHHLRAAAAAPS